MKLARLAARENISSGEVIRSGDEILQSMKEKEIIEATLKIIAQAAAEANASLCRSIDRIDQLHAQLHGTRDVA